MILTGKVALVTGASRGVGRGIARGLAESGATVYVTGRTTSRGGGIEPGTIESVAREVDEAGGRGIAVRCDHAVAAEIEALFARIERDSGRLDVLVNNAHSGFAELAENAGRRFWEIDPGAWERMNGVGLAGHYVASVYAARMMVAARSGLIVNVSSFGSLCYLFDVAYAVGKSALDRLTADIARELRPEGVVAVSLWPGFVWTELTSSLREEATPGYRRVLDAYGESPLVAGRAVAALASDPRVMRLSGRVHIAAEVAARHGLREEDGTLALSPRSFRRLAQALLPGSWQRLAALAPTVRVPLFLVAPALSRFAERLKTNGGFRGAISGKG
jgi:NAD(P)-dependent dehydrogenase (short-subunit alcohol dehydrogenase family)